MPTTVPIAAIHPTRPSGKTRQIVLLDVIRFVAALLVVMYHVGFRTFLGYPAGWHTVFASYAYAGWVGVPIFFVLSGFVITYSAQNTTPSGFLKSRALRLYPAVWICSTLTFALQLHVAGWSFVLLHAWLNALTLFPIGPIIDGSYWTLRVEMSFYALIFLMLLRGWLRFAGQIMLALAAVSSLVLSLGYAIDRGWFASADFIRCIPRFLLSSRWARLLLIDHAPHFAIGVFLWLLLFRGVTPFRLFALAFSFLAALLAIRVEWQEAASSIPPKFPLAPCLIIWAIAVAAIILSVRYNETILQALGPARANTMRTLGLVTYPLYLLHQTLADYIIHRFYGNLPDVLLMALSTLIPILLAYAVVRFAEKPVSNRLRQWLHTKSTPVLAATLP